MIEAVEKSFMQHPVFYVARVTKFLDEMIREHGDYLFVGLVFVSVAVIVWIFTRPRKHTVHELSVVFLPLGLPPKRESQPEPLLFREGSDF